MKISQLVPDPATVLALEPEELAGPLLQVLHTSKSNLGLIHRGNFTDNPGTVEGFAPDSHDAIRLAIMEAWIWLEREGLLVPTPGTNGANGWFTISRRGRQLVTAIDVSAYRRANLLPRALLHPRIGQKVWATFLRGDYDTAVFQAFKEVEVSVRAAARLPARDIGVSLMRKAFHTTTGRLRDKKAVEAERQSRLELFTGAIGSYKNPQSHRHVQTTAEETIEILLLATHLLRLVDAATSRRRR